MPNPTITAKDLATGAVTYNKPKYDVITGKAREARAFITFNTANAYYSAPHALGRIPTGFTVVATGRNGGAPGTVYSDDLPISFSKYNVALKCSQPLTWADIKVF